jgi:hypothetical protein
VSKPHVTLFVGVVAALMAAGPAYADDPPRPDDVSAADAYRESVPTAGGPKPTGQGDQQSKLAPGIAARIGSDATSALLREVATSAAYGAPQRPLRSASGPVNADDQRVSSPRLPSFGAASGAVGDAVGRGRLALLAALLFAILVGGVAKRLAAARARTR